MTSQSASLERADFQVQNTNFGFVFVTMSTGFGGFGLQEDVLLKAVASAANNDDNKDTFTHAIAYSGASNHRHYRYLSDRV